jgi:hypothetical protein
MIRSREERARTGLDATRVSGGDALFDFRRLAQHIAATPDRLDVVLALAGVRELLAQLADEHVDDLEFGLVHAAVEMVEEHLLGERRAFRGDESMDTLRMRIDNTQLFRSAKRVIIIETI